MNKRITQKVHKRKFAEVYAEKLSLMADMKIKPSRVRIKAVISEDSVAIIGSSRGYSVEYVFREKETKNGKSQE